jgi:serine/threonine protein kinase
MITNSGLRLGERYVLQERLAVGGMGEVWSAIDEVLNRPVAVKVLRNDLAPDTAFQARFRAEARTAAALSHGGIAAVYDYGESQGAAYLVMELVPGEALSAMISREGALGTDRTMQIVAQSARALHAAHRHGVIHRDIKPANLMITPELRVKVTDFGIARPRDHEPLTATGQVMGTAHYLAPELARGEIASPLSDVYALGVVAYECLAGWRPCDGDNQVAVATAHLQDEPPPLPTTIPAPVRAIVMSAMAKNPAERPQGANALAALMEDVRLRTLGGNPVAVQAEPLAAWPADAATPPRGVARSQPTRRDPGRDPGPERPEQQYRDRGQRQERGQQSRSDWDRSSSDRARDRQASEAARGSAYPAPKPPPSGAYQGQSSAYPGAGFSNAPDDPFEAPKRPRASHSRTTRSTSPTTSELPASRSSSGRPNRPLSIPLIALLILIVLVVLGAVWTKYHDTADKSHSLGIHSASTALVLVHEVVDTE